ncbi:MAG: hypothetical protein DRR11_18725 [Gammaproteobacteria bacterium]|nr:MAG: hypothetical protein DRQ59_12540 [Gammaproteobacteria bacterium]RLA27157.1 MAG: hypothetical protein DRR11_18725 [Gammaproteobacteria bacterium]
MKRKPSPYTVLIGKKSERPPIYVKYIEHSPIQLNGAAVEFERLELNPAIPYDDTGPCEENEELISIMLSLRNLGVTFSCDHKVRFSPSAFMQMLQDQGRLKEKYNAISWRGPSKWAITAYEME